MGLFDGFVSDLAAEETGGDLTKHWVRATQKHLALRESGPGGARTENHRFPQESYRKITIWRTGARSSESGPGGARPTSCATLSEPNIIVKISIM